MEKAFEKGCIRVYFCNLCKFPRTCNPLLAESHAITGFCSPWVEFHFQFDISFRSAERTISWLTCGTWPQSHVETQIRLVRVHACHCRSNSHSGLWARCNGELGSHYLPHEYAPVQAHGFYRCWQRVGCCCHCSRISSPGTAGSWPQNTHLPVFIPDCFVFPLD